MSKIQKPSNSILTQAEQIIADQPEGVRSGVVLQNTDVGAEVSAYIDPGETGGFKFGAVARWVKGKGKQAAAYVGWTPKA